MKFVVHKKSPESLSNVRLPRDTFITSEFYSHPSLANRRLRSNVRFLKVTSSDQTLLSEPPETTTLSQREAQANGRYAQRANNLAFASPITALLDAEIASLFAHYIDALAPWYDLNDAQRLFGTVVPKAALECPVLFQAIIAFSASHRYKILGSSETMAMNFHAACVERMLRLVNATNVDLHGNELAATCLLRSYEIINGSYDGDDTDNDR